MTRISKKTIIAAVLVALAFILTVTALVIAIVNRGANDGDGKETDKAAETVATESVASDGDAASSEDAEQTADRPNGEKDDSDPDKNPDNSGHEVKYESGEVSIDINDLA